MSHVGFFFRQAFDVMVFLWPITLVLSAAAVGAAISLERSGHIASDQVRLVLVTSAFVFLCAPIVAIVFWTDETGQRPASGVGGFVLSMLTLAYAVAVLVALVQAKAHRVALAAIAALLGWANVGGLFVASMAVTGDWL